MRGKFFKCFLRTKNIPWKLSFPYRIFFSADDLHTSHLFTIKIISKSSPSRLDNKLIEITISPQFKFVVRNSRNVNEHARGDIRSRQRLEQSNLVLIKHFPSNSIKNNFSRDEIRSAAIAMQIEMLSKSNWKISETLFHRAIILVFW